MPSPPPLLLLLVAMGFSTTVLGWDPPLGIPLGSILKYGLVGVLCLVGVIYWKQNDILYVPKVNQIGGANALNPPRFRNPAEWDMKFEDVRIRTPSGPTIHGWWIPQADSLARRRATIVFFHGNAGNIGARLPNFAQLYYSLRVNILAIDYRGYGESEGKPSEAGLLEDATSALLWLEGRRDLDHSQVVLFGRSLGGAVAIRVAAHLKQLRDTQPERLREMGFARLLHGPKGVIVENTFLSIAELAPAVLPLLRALMLPTWLLERLLTNRWASSRYLPQLDIPVLLISGLRDELVPPAQMRTLYELADTRWEALLAEEGRSGIPAVAVYESLEESEDDLLGGPILGSAEEDPEPEGAAGTDGTPEEAGPEEPSERTIARLRRLLTRLVTFATGGHNDTSQAGGRAYLEAMGQWLMELRALRFRRHAAEEAIAVGAAGSKGLSCPPGEDHAIDGSDEFSTSSDDDLDEAEDGVVRERRRRCRRQ